MYAYFPVEWRFGDDPMDGIGGVAVEDAGTLYVVRDEDDDADYPVGDEEMLVFKTSLRDLVAGAVDGWQEQDGFTGAAHEAASDALAAALRAAADMLDAAKRPNAEVTGHCPT